MDAWIDLFDTMPEYFKDLDASTLLPAVAAFSSKYLQTTGVSVRIVIVSYKSEKRPDSWSSWRPLRFGSESSRRRMTRNLSSSPMLSKLVQQQGRLLSRDENTSLQVSMNLLSIDFINVRKETRSSRKKSSSSGVGLLKERNQLFRHVPDFWN